MADPGPAVSKARHYCYDLIFCNAFDVKYLQAG